MNRLNELKSIRNDELATVLINQIYNDEIRAMVSDAEKDAGIENNKAIPYMGWFWRDVDFVRGVVTIATDGDYVAVCENNKWGYAQRSMNADEAEQFCDFVDRALCAYNTRSIGSVGTDDYKHILAELRSWMSTLKVDHRRRIKWQAK